MKIRIIGAAIVLCALAACSSGMQAEGPLGSAGANAHFDGTGIGGGVGFDNPIVGAHVGAGVGPGEIGGGGSAHLGPFDFRTNTFIGY
jgi:hypothetical protein